MKSILILANKYPNNLDSNGLVFVQQLVWALADMGVVCSVICPLAANLNYHYFSLPEHIQEKTENGNTVDVYFPKFFGLGQSHYILGKSPAPITTNFFSSCVDRTIQKYAISFDAVYGHFMVPAGIAAARIGRKYSIPSYYAHGESSAWTIEQYGSNRARQELATLSGVVAVSTRNKELVLQYGIVSEDIIQVFPNGYREERFYRRDKSQARQKFGWPEDAYIIGMCGSFIERKGVLRLQAAVDQIPDTFFACAGKGKQVPTSDRCLWSKPVDNQELPWFYSALDAFVLPTQNEGCCNAIVEAIACGCPIVSSNCSFNADICDETNSILIDPDNIAEIRDAIVKLRSDPEKRDALSRGSLQKAKSLTLVKRAEKIAEFMNL